MLRAYLQLAAILALLGTTAFAGEGAEAEVLRLRRLVRAAGGLVHWVADPYVRYDLARRNPSETQPYSPPVDRKVLLAAALRRGQAEKRLLCVYVWRVQGRHMYRAPVVDTYARLALFSDPELAALLNRKFVPVRLYLDARAAAALGLRLGRPGEPNFLRVVEPALLFVAPDGRVLHMVERMRTFSPYWTRHVLRRVLEAHPEYNEPSVETAAVAARVGKADPMARVALAREQCLDGDEAKALATLAGVEAKLREKLGAARKALAKVGEAKRPKEGARGGRARRLRALRLRVLKRRVRDAERNLTEAVVLRARALRLLGRGEEALQVLLGLAKELRAAPAVLAEKGRVELALGRWADAAATWKTVSAGGEQAFRLGQALYLLHRREEAATAFRAALASGEVPWTWRAAAMLARSDDTTPMDPLAHAFELVDYGLRQAYGPAIPRTTELPPPKDPRQAVPEVVQAGVRFLLAHQDPDGAWSDARYAYWPAPWILPNVRVAVTALAASALLRWREVAPEAVQRALARAEAVLCDDRRLNTGREEEVYAQAYRLLYWVRKAKAFPREAAACRKEMARIVKRVRAIQDAKTGFFAHEYPNAFCSATMLWSLHLVREAGVPVPRKVLELGRKALLSARREDGSFVYGGAYRPPRRRSSPRRPGKDQEVTNLKNAMARMPHCEGALLVLGASNRQRLARAGQVFLRYLERLARVRKCDFHSDGELGGFFFWHGVFHTSEVAGLMPPPIRDRLRAALLRLVVAIPEIDGSFIDSHELGKSYGTAMALLVLGNVSR